MQVTDEMVEITARILADDLKDIGLTSESPVASANGTVSPLWTTYTALACRALTAALSDQERAVEVKTGSLAAYWEAVADVFSDMDINITQLGGEPREKLAKKARETAKALNRSALVDVQAVEPVAGYRRRLPQYGFEHYEFEQPGYESPSISDWETLYTHPPHREGEDSAEVERLRGLLSRAEEYVIDGVTNAKAEAEMNAPYPARAPRCEEALAEVRQLYADIRAALAATRSGSATGTSGKDA